MTRHALFLVALLLAACGSTDEPRFRIEPAPAPARMRIAAGTIELREVTLPAYAAEPAILAEAADGALYPQGASLWADDPAQGVTSALVTALSARTSATVAAEPWPLTDPAQVRLDVRVAQFFASADGAFEMTGQFAIASPDRVVREFIRSFEIRVPIRGEGPGALASAQGQAISELATLIATALR